MDTLTEDQQARLRIGLHEIIHYSPRLQQVWWLRRTPQEQEYLIRWAGEIGARIAANALDELARIAVEANAGMAAFADALIAAIAAFAREDAP